MIDKTGTQAAIKSGPRNMEHTGSGGGSLDLTGSKANCAKAPASNQFFTKGNIGAIDGVGVKANLDSTPVTGWVSSNTPLSDRAVKQSK